MTAPVTFDVTPRVRIDRALTLEVTPEVTRDVTLRVTVSWL